MKESFVFFKSWKDAINGLPPDVRLEIYEAVVEYGTLGNVPDLKPMAAIAFNFIKNDLDRSAEKYAKIVERNKTNGKKGGRPKNPENPVGFSETQEKHNKDDNEYDDDNDILLGKESKEGDELFPGEDNILEPDKNSDPDLSKKVAPKKVFRPPSVQEVQAYCNERSNGISGYEFVTFYQSKGWMIGKNKMKDWQAAVRTWEAKRNKDGNNQKTGSGSSNVRNGNDKVSGTTEILGGARYTEFT